MVVSEGGFPARLKAARQLRGVGQSPLARVVGVTQQTVSEWENGHADPAFSSVVRIAKHLSVTLDYLAGRTDSPGETYRSDEAAVTIDIIREIVSPSGSTHHHLDVAVRVTRSARGRRTRRGTPAVG